MNIEINVGDVDLNTVIGATVEYDEYGDPCQTGGVTLADGITRQLVERVMKSEDYGQQLRDRVRAIRDEEIRELLRPVLAEAIAAPLQKTNGYGDPVGQPTSLRELLVDEARKLLSRAERPGASSYRSGDEPIVTQIIRAQVTELFKTEITAEVQKVRDAVLAQVGGDIAEQVQQTVRDALAANAKAGKR